MSAPGSLLYSLQPYLITEPDTTSRNIDIYRLDDAKNALDIPAEHISEDANILMRMQEAQAIIGTITGLNIADCNVEMLFLNTTAERIDALELSESDVKSIQAIQDVGADGSVVDIPQEYWTSCRANGRMYVQRHDGKFFRRGPGLVAKAKVVRGLTAGSDLAKQVRAVMNMLMVELGKNIGATSPAGFAENPTFLRLIRMSTSQTANITLV